MAFELGKPYHAKAFRKWPTIGMLGVMDNGLMGSVMGLTWPDECDFATQNEAVTWLSLPENQGGVVSALVDGVPTIIQQVGTDRPRNNGFEWVGRPDNPSPFA